MLNKLCFNKIGHILFCRIKDDHENFLKSNLPAVSQGLTNLAKFTEIHIFNYSHIVVPYSICAVGLITSFYIFSFRNSEEEHLKFIVSRAHAGDVQSQVGPKVHFVKMSFSMFTYFSLNIELKML